jgi:hypothetical protein
MGEIKSKKMRKILNKTSKRKRNHKRKYLLNYVGGCGCNNDNLWKRYSGGNGDKAFSIPGYPLNNYEHDPNSPGIVTNARNVPDIKIGGKKKMKKSRIKKVIKLLNKLKNKSKKTKKFKGGFTMYNSDLFLGNNPNSPITNFGTSPGAFDQYNLMNGQTTVNPAVYEQPIMKMYGDHNSPLI